MLATTEQIVVLLDEFDELGRDRSEEPEVLSRFITTAMLPKLIAINKERKIVFLLATNYLSRFDAAFRRGGRFDMVIQIMPPTAEEKLAKPEWEPVLTRSLARLATKKKAEAIKWLGELTYLEAEELVYKLQPGVEDTHEEIKAAHDAATLTRKVGRKQDDKTWREVALEEAHDMRLPAPRKASRRL
jgi:AAA+ superfamily predicted ATPase